MADGGVWTLLSDEQMTALEVDERWYRVYPPLIPEPEVLPPFELIRTVEFTSAPKVEVDGVFKHPDDGGFRNYVVSATYTASGNVSIRYRMRDSGSDDLGSNYTNQRLEAQGDGNPSGSRATETFGRINNGASGYSGFNWSVYGYNAGAPTAARSTTIFSFSGEPVIIDYASTYSPSTSYDGFTIYPSGGNMTGTLSVYGVRS